MDKYAQYNIMKILKNHHKGSIEYSQAEHQLHYLYKDHEYGGLTLKFENELDFCLLHDELKAIFVYILKL